MWAFLRLGRRSPVAGLRNMPDHDRPRLRNIPGLTHTPVRKMQNTEDLPSPGDGIRIADWSAFVLTALCWSACG